MSLINAKQIRAAGSSGDAQVNSGGVIGSVSWGTIHRIGLESARPAASSENVGYLYYSTDTSSLTRSNGVTWEVYAPSGGGGPAGIVGRAALNPSEAFVVVPHSTIDTATSFPVVALETTGVAADLLIVGVYDRTSTSFRVALSGNPPAGSYLIWHLSVPTSQPLAVDADFAYNPDGSLASITTVRGVRSYTYNPDGTLAAITGTGEYQSFAFTYVDGILTHTQVV